MLICYRLLITGIRSKLIELTVGITMDFRKIGEEISFGEIFLVLGWKIGNYFPQITAGLSQLHFLTEIYTQTLAQHVHHSPKRRETPSTIFF